MVSGFFTSPCDHCRMSSAVACTLCHPMAYLLLAGLIAIELLRDPNARGSRPLALLGVAFGPSALVTIFGFRSIVARAPAGATIEAEYLPQESQVRAVIIAAGSGKSLLPLTEDRPKCMLDIKGRSILER